MDKNSGILISMDKSLEIIAGIRTISKAFIGKVVTVGTSPTLLIDSYRKGSAYTLINPTGAVGTTISVPVLPVGTLLSSADIVKNSNNISVSNYDSARIFLDITAIDATGNIEVIVQSMDVLSGKYVDIQSIFNVNSVGTYYTNIGGMGVDTDLRLRWIITGTGTITVTGSVACVLKEGLGGTATSGGSQTLYIGNEGVSTNSAFAILEGQTRDFYVRENIKIYGISTTPVDIRIIEWG